MTLHLPEGDAIELQQLYNVFELRSSLRKLLWLRSFGDLDLVLDVSLQISYGK